MFGRDFAKKCIIVHFFGDGKRQEKALNAVPNPEASGSGAETKRKDLRKLGEGKMIREEERPALDVWVPQAEAYATQS